MYFRWLCAPLAFAAALCSWCPKRYCTTDHPQQLFIAEIDAVANLRRVYIRTSLFLWTPTFRPDVAYPPGDNFRRDHQIYLAHEHVELVVVIANVVVRQLVEEDLPDGQNLLS